MAWALDAGVRFISLFWGNPAEHVAAIHRAGALVAATAGSGEEARQQVAAGVDVVVAQGWEAGGHVPGAESPPWRWCPPSSTRWGRSPVVAAGGIADGRGQAAAVMALGAAGAWIGTRLPLSAPAERR